MISENARQNSINSYVTKSTYIINTLLLLYHVFFGFYSIRIRHIIFIILIT